MIVVGPSVTAHLCLIFDVYLGYTTFGSGQPPPQCFGNAGCFSTFFVFVVKQQIEQDYRAP